MALLLVTRVPRDGKPFNMAINENNVIEITESDSGSWMKYWDGKEVRSAVIQESPNKLCGA